MPQVKKTSAPKKSGPKKAAAKKVVAVVVTPDVVTPVVDTPVVDTPVVDTPVDVPAASEMLNYSDEFTTLQSQLKEALNLVKNAMTGLNALEKRVARDKKVVDKKMKVKVKRPHDPNKPPSGFCKPLNVSTELKKFLNLKEGELIARTEVTKRINAYCKEHGLQQEDDKRILCPDTALKKLLRYDAKKEEKKLTFFNLQRFLKHHYPNKEGVFTQ